MTNTFDGFTDYEKECADRVLKGETVVASMFNFCKPYTPFLKWAQARNLVVKIDRTSKIWGNPFKVGESGTLDEVLSCYKDDYLGNRPELVAKAKVELRGKVLACWCKKHNKYVKGAESLQPCHGDILAAIANGSAKLSIKN
jgi:hypothetical protein